MSRQPLPLRARHPRRFSGRSVELTWRQRIAGWLKGRGWVSEKFVFDEILPGQPGYDDAPYEEKFVFADGSFGDLDKFQPPLS